VAPATAERRQRWDDAGLRPVKSQTDAQSDTRARRPQRQVPTPRSQPPSSAPAPSACETATQILRRRLGGASHLSSVPLGEAARLGRPRVGPAVDRPTPKPRRAPTQRVQARASRIEGLPPPPDPGRPIASGSCRPQRHMLPGLLFDTSVRVQVIRGHGLPSLALTYPPPPCPHASTNPESTVTWNT